MSTPPTRQLQTDTVLGGLRVLDLSRGYAGALVSLILADFGAEVIRVEPPDGDDLRHHPAFPLWQRGKRSVVLDLRDAAARADAVRLAECSDVLLETFRPGVAERLGLDHAALAKVNPGLVHTSITGFGRRGPYAGLKGYEGVVMAKLGAMGHVAGMAPRPGPAFPSAPLASFSAAQTALHGTLAALYVRERTGRGQKVDATLVQAMAAHDPWEWFIRIVCERYPQAFTSAPPYSARGVPNTGFAFRLLVCLTKDGRWLQFSQTSPHLFREFMEALGLASIFDDPEWAGAPDLESEDKRERFWEILLEAARSRTLAEWDEVFQARPNVWAEVFRTTREALDHPQLVHNGQVLELGEQSTLGSTTAGRSRQLGPIVRMSATPARSTAAAPCLGEGTNEILAALRAGSLRPAAAASTEEPPARALDGVTVLELGLWYAAPYGSALLADLGARVIKVEPLAGEPMRHIMPFPEAGGVKVLQGKESVALALDRPESRDIIRRLARRADIVLMSYRGGVAERLGVDYASLARENPKLVYLTAPGYGADGPCARKPAFAPTIGAASGVALRQAGPSIPSGTDLSLEEIKPASIRLGFAAQAPGNADGCSALGVATALLLGLVARERTGRGQEMLTSMLCTTMYAVSDEALDVAEPAARHAAFSPDAMLYGIGPLYRLYETASGWVFLAAPKEDEWQSLCRVLAPRLKLDLAGDPRFATAPERARHGDELAGLLADAFRGRTAAEWEQDLLGVDVACVELATGPIPRAVMQDAITRDAGFLTEVDHPSFGRHRRLGPLVNLSLTPGEARPAPVLGQHTEAVLCEVGFTAAEIGAMESDGLIVRGSPANAALG